MNGESSTEPKKRSKRFYMIVSAAVLLLIIIGVVCVDYVNRTSYGPGPIEIEVTADKPFYLQGEEVNFTIYVNNPQNWPVAYPYSIVYVIDKDGVYVASFGGGQVDYGTSFPTFSPHSKTLFQQFLVPWNQKMDLNGTLVQVEPGNYTLTVSLTGIGYDESSNCTFEIRPN